MTTPELREGETFRFSLVSLRPIPEALIAHVHRVLTDDAVIVERRPVAASGLFALTWLFTSAAETESLCMNLRGPAMALGVDSAFITGRLATEGPSLIVTDVDSTFITQEVIELLAAYAGVEDDVREVTESAMRGEIDFAQSLTQRVATLRGLPLSVIDDVTAQLTLSPGADTLVRIAHEHGARFGLVSGGFLPVLEPLAERYAIDFWSANGLGIEDDKLTGTTSGPVIDAAAKRKALERWADALDIDLSMVVAVGDGANDLKMLEVCGLGVGFMPKDIVLAEADCSITFPRLDAVAALVGWDTASSD